ncbi:hypothetical protein [Halorhabdus amylolytica]|uniref:hypothetical protein n=1 Tax=Halorhabdus amylolytica TaxID=2559573 RepID=UPI0010AA375F|nr:hypothetical protein [Halorhabdus amylolytica]
MAWLLIVLTGSLGVRGLLGGGQFIVDPSGDLVGLSTAELSGSPFSDFLLPGIVLFVVLGLGPILVVVGLTRERRWAWWGAVGVSVALIAWVLAEGWVVGFGERLQVPNLLLAITMLSFSLSRSVRNRYVG